MTRISAATLTGLAAGLTTSLFCSTALAESWVQVEAQPSLTQAMEAASDYASQLPNVVGFELPGRWHAIVIGPYADDVAARAALRSLRAQGLVPTDSYTTEGDRFGTPFFPIGANLTTATPQEDAPVEQVAAPETDAPESVEVAVEETGAAVEVVAEVVPEVVPEVIDETPAQARRSEAQMDRDEKKALQVALKFAGFYNAAIDGSYGRGTRAAMADWQEANGFEPTGVMTTLQREQALLARQSVIDSLGIAKHVDTTAGIEIDLPFGLVTFDSYSPPFAKFTSKDGSGVEVLLISQSGDEDTLGGLYEIMQTLEIVPMEGERSRNKSSFSLTGRNETSVTHAEAKLTAGAVKGWLLRWPTGDSQRRDMALDAMRASFAPNGDAVLPDAYGEGAAQDIDLISGLKIRRADRAGTGFYVDAQGAVLTAAATIEECGSLTLDDSYGAQVVALADGMALLAPDERLAPLHVAAFDSRLPRLQSDVSAAGFAYGGRLGSPSMNFGKLAEHQGLNGEADVLRLEMEAAPSEAGAPLLAMSGGVIGMLKAAGDEARSLPENVSFAYDMERVVTFLSAQGITVSASEADGELSGAQLVDQARDMTVLVSCWN